jgi:hypothetical protein
VILMAMSSAQKPASSSSAFFTVMPSLEANGHSPLGYTLEGHHGETPSPVSFGWVLAT